jgi:hypothetical protein
VVPWARRKCLSLTDLAEQMLDEKAPLVEREIGCSVATASQLILIRETLTSHTHADADEMLYVVAGDAVLKIADKDTQVSCRLVRDRPARLGALDHEARPATRRSFWRFGRDTHAAASAAVTS